MSENLKLLQYFDELGKTSVEYKKIILGSLRLKNIWEYTMEKNNLYIKMNNDIITQTYNNLVLYS